MNKIIILLTFIVVSCASNQNKYEEQIELLKKEVQDLKKVQEEKTKKEESKDVNKESDISLKEYLNQNQSHEENITHKIDLGNHYNINFQLYITDKGGFWIRTNKVLDIESITLLIPHKSKSPELLNFIQVNELIYETKGDSLDKKSILHLTIKVKKQKSLVFQLEVN